MNMSIKLPVLAKAIANGKLRKEYGAEQEAKIQARISDIQAAVSLADLNPGGKPHPLPHEGEHVYSLNLKHPYRMLIQVVDDPLPLTAGNTLDIAQVRSVAIIGIKDTHDGTKRRK